VKAPLRSDRVTFGAGGVRHGHTSSTRRIRRFRITPERVFHDANRVGCTALKLDANFWGAMHGGCSTIRARDA
jgi:hypothetical protein